MLYFGGDYNPEQWPAGTWAEDLALMREAAVNLVTVGVFSWSRLQPAPDVFDFGWLDQVLEGLHNNGIGVCLATPTASPPPWFTRQHPEAMPVTRERVRLTHGSRDTYCINAPAYRAASTRIAGELAQRYTGHPALRLWHVHNEYGTWCFCPHCETEFRSWLRRRHGSLEALNAAWSTDFWSQRYGDWEEICAPRATQYLRNPAQELDYRRFLSDAFLRHFTEQRWLLGDTVPVTTNFVLGEWVPVDHARFASEVDLVAIDHYPDCVESAMDQRAFAADRARGWARSAGHQDGRWLLMEHAPGAVHAKGALQMLNPGSIARAADTYLDRGSIGIMYFQWRASPGGAEQWHPAMVPHEGASSPVFKEIAVLGRSLATRAPHTRTAEVAVIYDEESMWAWQSEHLPTRHVHYESVVRQWHGCLTAAFGLADVVPANAPLQAYRLVVVPALYLMPATTHAALRGYVNGGGQLVLTCASGLADEHARVTPGALDDLIGASITGRRFLPPGEPIPLADGSSGGLWHDLLAVRTAKVQLESADGQPVVITQGNVAYIATLGFTWLPGQKVFHVA